MFKTIRIFILLIILGSVASTLWIQKNLGQDWSGTLDIRLIPVVADQKPQTQRFIDKLTVSDFDDIHIYLKKQGEHFGVDLQYGLNITLEEQTTNTPPVVPNANSSRLEILLWSLRLKWWAWKNQLEDHHLAQTRIYILYQSPEKNKPLAHSTGLQNGLIGLVNARASTSQQPLHQIVITHELLHIWGASDKYDTATGIPFFPDGYAAPNQTPLFPQRFTEIMARAKPVSQTKYDVATHLKQTLIGNKTALEIGWIKQQE